MEWEHLPFDIRQLILRKAINLQIYENRFKWKHATSSLTKYYSIEAVFEFFQIQNERTGMNWFNERSLLFKERRSHGIEILELASVSGSINQRKPTYQKLKDALRINCVKGYTKLKNKVEFIHALQKL